MILHTCTVSVSALDVEIHPPELFGWESICLDGNVDREDRKSLVFSACVMYECGINVYNIYIYVYMQVSRLYPNHLSWSMDPVGTVHHLGKAWKRPTLAIFSLPRRAPSISNLEHVPGSFGDNGCLTININTRESMIKNWSTQLRTWRIIPPSSCLVSRVSFPDLNGCSNPRGNNIAPGCGKGIWRFDLRSEKERSGMVQHLYI